MTFELDVKDLNVLITGGSSGIGLEISKAFLLKGANVINWDLQESEDVQCLAHQYSNRYTFLNIDVTDEDSIKWGLNRIPETVDVLVNNAGIIIKSQLEDIQTDEWDRIYDINVKGTMLVTKNLVPKIKKSKRGRIINLASMTAKIGLETYSLYSSTKAAVANLTKVWALELAPYEITVNALCPGWVDTPMKGKLVEGIAKIHETSKEEAENLILSHIPQRRFIQTEEIAFTCLFLASTYARGINGQELYIDTGLTNMFKPGVHLKQQEGEDG
jgi:NAD(P)-dependent dehydrogenase (short-subunit alcohol dehydrogenase family)